VPFDAVEDVVATVATCGGHDGIDIGPSTLFGDGVTLLLFAPNGRKAHSARSGREWPQGGATPAECRAPNLGRWWPARPAPEQEPVWSIE